MRCIIKSQYAHRLAIPSRNFRVVSIDYWWRHHNGHDRSGKARRCHGNLGFGPVDGASDWTCSWWIPRSSKRMAVAILGTCYGGKPTPRLSLPLSLLTDRAILITYTRREQLQSHLSFLFESHTLLSSSNARRKGYEKRRAMKNSDPSWHLLLAQGLFSNYPSSDP